MEVPAQKYIEGLKNKLHILLVSYEFPPETAIGGIGTYMHHLAGLLHHYGHKVTVFSATLNGTVVRCEDRGYCQNYLVPARNNEEFRMEVLPVFAALLKKHPVDVMESPEVGACALEIKKAYPAIPLIVKMHTPGVLITRVSASYQTVAARLRFVAGALRRGRWDLGHWAKKAKNKEMDVEYQICLLADQLLSPSRALAKWVSRFWELPAAKIQIMPNPFVFNQALLEMPLGGRPKLITFIGKLSVLKGMMMLTDAIPLLLEQNPEYLVYLVGRDELSEGVSMKAYMQERLAGFSDKISFTGALAFPELAELVGRSQICIFPSLWENYPNVVLEAMAGGAVVVATNKGGVPEIIDDGKTGLLFDPLDPIAFVKKVKTLTVGEERRLDIAKAARAKVLRHFMNPAFEKEILEPYCSAVTDCHV
jgi:glycogen synthase